MEIIIYATSTCTACSELTKWLQKQNVSYTKRITDEDPTAMADFMAVNDGMIGVPFTVIKNAQGEVHKIAGLQFSDFKKILAL